MHLLLTSSAALFSLAQSGNVRPGLPYIDILVLLVGVAGACFAVCRSANRR